MATISHTTIPLPPRPLEGHKGLFGRVLVVGVPTSIGYGVATGGTAAMHAMLASCAPGIAVVNIDNGFGAACVAHKIALATRK